MFVVKCHFHRTNNLRSVCDISTNYSAFCSTIKELSFHNRSSLVIEPAQLSRSPKQIGWNITIRLREHVFSGGQKIGQNIFFGRNIAWNFDTKFQLKNIWWERSTWNFGRKISGEGRASQFFAPEICGPTFRVDFSSLKFFNWNF